jgi:hypothetical protein
MVKADNSDKQLPSPEDMDVLRRFAPAFQGSIDELAGEVIQLALRSRAAVRQEGRLAASS